VSPHLTLYSGPNCSLCDKAKALIDKVALDTPLTLETIDITSDPALYEAHRYEIPVIAVDGDIRMRGKVSEFWLRKALRGEPLDGYRLL
jgi:glutaredoxin